MAKPSFWKFIPVLLLFTLGCTVSSSPSQVEFAPTAVASRQALMKGQIKEALTFHEAQALAAEKKAAASAEPKPFLEAARAAYKEASRICRFTGETQKMIAYSEKSLEIARKIGQPVGELNSIDQMIMTYVYIGNDIKAKELIDQGFKILPYLPPQSPTRIDYEGLFYWHLGHHFLRLGDNESSIEAYLQSVYLREKRLSLTLMMSETSKRAARESLLLSMTGPGLANGYYAANKLEEAFVTYQRALNLIHEWGLKYVYEDSFHSGMGSIYERQNNFDEALESYKKAVAVGQSQQRSEHMVKLRLRIGNLLIKSGKPAEAIPYLEMAIQQIESTRSLLQSQEHRQFYFERSLHAYSMMIGSCAQVGKEEEAFNYSEHARSRDFLDTLGNKVQLSRTISGLIEEERTLRERIASGKLWLSGIGEQEADKSDLRRQLAEAEKDYNEFLVKVRKQDKEQASLMSVEPLNLKQVQELLDPGTTLIEYFVTGSNTHIWLVEKGTVHHISVTLTKAQINHQVKALL